MPGEVRSVGVRNLKSRARDLLPEGSACRALVLSQPDDIPETDRIPLARMLSRFLSDELG